MTDMTTDTAQATVEAAHELLNAAGLPADTLAGRVGRLVAERDRYRQALEEIEAMGRFSSAAREAMMARLASAATKTLWEAI